MTSLRRDLKLATTFLFAQLLTAVLYVALTHRAGMLGVYFAMLFVVAIAVESLVAAYLISRLSLIIVAIIAFWIIVAMSDVLTSDVKFTGAVEQGLWGAIIHSIIQVIAFQLLRVTSVVDTFVPDDNDAK